MNFAFNKLKISKYFKKYIKMHSESLSRIEWFAYFVFGPVSLISFIIIQNVQHWRFIIFSTNAKYLWKIVLMNMEFAAFFDI